MLQSSYPGVLKPHTHHHFKFELGWLHREGFQDMVKMVWDRSVAGQSAIHRWNNKLRALRKHLSSWARFRVGLLKKGEVSLVIYY